MGKGNLKKKRKPSRAVSAERDRARGSVGSPAAGPPGLKIDPKTRRGGDLEVSLFKDLFGEGRPDTICCRAEA